MEEGANGNFSGVWRRIKYYFVIYGGRGRWGFWRCMKTE